MNYYNQLKELLEEHNVGYEENQDSDKKIILLKINIKNRNDLRVVIVLAENESFVDLIFGNVATISSVLKREEALKLINKLNNNYRYGTLAIMDEGNIVYSYSLPLPKYYDEMFIRVLFQVLSLMVDTVEDVYQKFMKLEWS